jgi:hypothetical protein
MPWTLVCNCTVTVEEPSRHLVHMADGLLQSPEVPFRPSPRKQFQPPHVVGGAIKVRPGPSVLGYQIVTHSITRSMSSIVNSELRLRLF